jgi:Lon protease-like protein
MALLPLFPLNTVLFPGTPITLHIFEDRYKLMIGRCVAERQPFGVLLLESGTAEHQPGMRAVPYPVGCSAHITEVQPVGMGRMNIVAIGHERFRVREFHHDQPYLVGDVEYLPTQNDDPLLIVSHANRLRPWVERYLMTLGRLENIQFNISHLPRDPLTFSYLAVSVLKIDPHDKQDVLQANLASEVVQQVLELYRKEVTLFDVLINKPELASTGIFSVN